MDQIPYLPIPLSHSAKKVDLHVRVVPASLWRPILRFSYNSICVEAISVGFVRSYPEDELHKLREEISNQLDLQLLPNGYIFLRSVGKCLTLVTPKQEKLLKIRHFLPPLAPCPEIYILDGSTMPDHSLPPLQREKSKHYQKANAKKKPRTQDSRTNPAIFTVPQPHPHSCTPPQPHSCTPPHPHSCTPPHPHSCTPPFLNTPYHYHPSLYQQQHPYSLPFHNTPSNIPSERVEPLTPPAVRQTFPAETQLRPQALKKESVDDVALHRYRKKSPRERHHTNTYPGTKANSNNAAESPLPYPSNSYPSSKLQPEKNENEIAVLSEQKSLQQRQSTLTNVDCCDSDTECTDYFEEESEMSEDGTPPCSLHSIISVDVTDPEVIERTAALQKTLHATPDLVLRDEPSVQGESNANRDHQPPLVTSRNDGEHIKATGKQNVKQKGKFQSVKKAIGYSDVHGSVRQPKNLTLQDSMSNQTGQMQNTTGKKSTKKRRQRSETYPPGGSGKMPFENLSQPQKPTSNSPLLNSVQYSPVDSPDLPPVHDLLGASSDQAHSETAQKHEFSPRAPLPPIRDVPSTGPKLHTDSPQVSGPKLSTGSPQVTKGNDDIFAQIRLIRQECDQLSLSKSELSTSLRSLQHTLKAQRQRSDKEWRRRFFREKKQTSVLEDKIKRLKNELQQLQNEIDRKIGSHLRDSLNNSSQAKGAPSEHSNIKTQCRHFELHNRELRMKLEARRQKLATEKQAHRNIVGECRLLKKQLVEKKIAYSRCKLKFRTQ